MKTMLKVLACAVVVVGMAYAENEITTQVYLKAEKGYVNITRSPATLQLDWNGNQVYGPVTYSLTTNWTALARGQIATNGYCVFRHVGTSNVVDVSFDNGTNSHLRLKAGEYQLLRLHPTIDITTVQAKSDAPAQFEVTLLED